MIAIGIVLRVRTGRIRCLTASLSTVQSPVITELKMKWLATKSRNAALVVPAWTLQPHASWNGSDVRPAVRRPDGGSHSGVPLSTSAKK